MNRDQIKGKMKDVKGRVERQAGEWTGNKDAQVKGMGDQLEGKVQKGVGDLKDAGRKAMKDVRNGMRRDQPSGLRHEKDIRPEDESPEDRDRRAA